MNATRACGVVFMDIEEKASSDGVFSDVEDETNNKIVIFSDVEEEANNVSSVFSDAKQMANSNSVVSSQMSSNILSDVEADGVTEPQ